jgi:hypothetical protein
MYQQIAIILFGLLIIGLIAGFFTTILQIGLWVWEKIQTILKWISYLIAIIINRIMSPNKFNGKVAFWRIGIWLIFNILILAILQYTFVAWDLFWITLALMGFNLLIIISKMVMIGEDNLIMEGFLHKDKAIFRNLQGSIPFPVLVIASIMFLLSLTANLFALDKVLPNVIFSSHGNVEILDWLVMIILQIPLIKNNVELFEFVKLDNMQLQLTSTYGAALSISIKVIIGMIVYGAIMLQIKQLKNIKSLLQAFESDDSDIQYIQQKAARFPSVVKKELINLSLRHPDSKVRRRAISVVSHAQIISFPQAFIGSLHKEKDEELKKWGLKQVLKILNDPTLPLDSNRRNKIYSRLKFQIKKKKKQHNEAVLKLLKDIKENLFKKK